MAWDDTKVDGLIVEPDEWNAMVTDQKNRLNKDGTVALTAEWDAGQFKILAQQIEAYNKSTLGSESLDETDFATHAKWDVTGDFDDTGGNAAYSHSAGSGTLTQTSGNMAVAGVGNRWYKVVYTVSGATTDASAQITTAFAASATSLTITNGTQTTYFRSAASPGDFVISGSSSSGGFTLDDLSLKEIQGGNLIAHGLFTGGGTAGIKVNSDGTVELSSLTLTGDLSGVGGFKQPFNFMQSNVAASQSAVAIDVLGLSGNTEYVMPYAGSVMAISVASNAARSAGTLTVDATIDGTVTGLQAVLDDDPTTYASNTQAKDTDAFTAGQRIGVKITTDGSWAPTTADIVVTVIIEM